MRAVIDLRPEAKGLDSARMESLEGGQRVIRRNSSAQAPTWSGCSRERRGKANAAYPPMRAVSITTERPQPAVGSTARLRQAFSGESVGRAKTAPPRSLIAMERVGVRRAGVHSYAICTGIDGPLCSDRQHDPPYPSSSGQSRRIPTGWRHCEYWHRSCFAVEARPPRRPRDPGEYTHAIGE